MHTTPVQGYRVENYVYFLPFIPFGATLYIIKVRMKILFYFLFSSIYTITFTMYYLYPDFCNWCVWIMGESEEVKEAVAVLEAALPEVPSVAG